MVGMLDGFADDVKLHVGGDGNIDDLNLFYTEMGREELIDRHDSPWDNADRRPSHANRRKALRRQMIGNELLTITTEWSLPQKIIHWAETLIALAT